MWYLLPPSTVSKHIKVISNHHVIMMGVGLTAGRAKKEIPKRAKPADNKRPVHVCGVLSP